MRGILKPIRAVFERIFILRLIVRTVQELSEDDATHLAAGVAFYALFSLFPLLMGLTVVLSYIVEPAEVSDYLTRFVGGFIPGSEELIRRNLEAALRLRGAIGLFSIVGLLWSSSAVFGAITRAVNRAWDVHRDRPVYISKPRQLLMSAVTGCLLALSIAVPTLSRLADRAAEIDALGSGQLYDAARVLAQSASLALAIAIFLVLYKFLPNTKTHWRYVWVGAVVAGVLFEASKSVFIVYVERVANFDNVYGSLSPVIALLLWTYVSSLILILGAELSSEYGRMRNNVERGRLLSGSKRRR